MPVTLVNPYIPPPLVYDQVHVSMLTITQELTTYSLADVTCTLVLYHIDSNGQKIFSTDPKDTIVCTPVHDAELWVKSKAAIGDTRGIAAMNGIKLIAQLMVEYQTSLGKATVS